MYGCAYFFIFYISSQLLDLAWVLKAEAIKEMHFFSLFSFDKQWKARNLHNWTITHAFTVDCDINAYQNFLDFFDKALSVNLNLGICFSNTDTNLSRVLLGKNWMMSASDLCATEDTVLLLLDYLVDPLLPARPSSRDTPSESLQQSVAKQVVFPCFVWSCILASSF